MHARVVTARVRAQMGGVSAETAMAKRSDLKGRATSAASPDNDPGSQRASAMAALSAEHAANKAPPASS